MGKSLSDQIIDILHCEEKLVVESLKSFEIHPYFVGMQADEVWVDFKNFKFLHMLNYQILILFNITTMLLECLKCVSVGFCQ